MSEPLKPNTEEIGIDLHSYIHLLTVRGKKIRNLVRWRYMNFLVVSLGALSVLFSLMRDLMLTLTEFIGLGGLTVGVGVLLIGFSLSKPRAVLTAEAQVEKTRSVLGIWENQKQNYSSISQRDHQMFDILAVHTFKAAHTEVPQILECRTCELLLSAMSPEFKVNHALNATFHYLEQTATVSLGELLVNLTEAISGEETGFIDPEGAEVLAHELLQLDCPIETLLAATDSALVRIGDLFETREIYYPQVLQAALAAKNTLRVLKEEFPTLLRQGQKARILLGVIKGDIHDIGKNIVKMFLEFNGYEVIDLGVDISPVEFIKAVSQHSPDLVGISAFINTVIPAFKETVLALRKAGFTKPMLAGGIAINALTVKKLKKELEVAVPGENGEIIYAHNVQEVLKSVNSLFPQEHVKVMVE